MKVTYKNKNLEKTCTVYAITKKEYGEKMAIKIHQRITELTAATSIEELTKNKIGRCHLLKGNRKNQYAMDLEHPYRLIFIEVENELQIVKVIEIVDYH